MRTVLLTGHTSGIGFAICNSLLTAGHSVIGVARTSIKNQPGLHQYQLDLADLASLESATREWLSSHSIDAVICNAGSGTIGAVENFSATQIEHSIKLNLTSPMVLVRALLPAIKKHPRSDVVFIGSESALQGGRYGAIYSAAKFGLRGFAQSLRHESASANCHVGLINPGMVRTSFFDDLSFEPGPDEQHALQATDVAHAVMQLIESPANAVIDEININPVHHVVRKK